MKEYLVKVKLHGRLAKALGISDLELSVTRPSEILRAIEANTGSFLNYLRTFQNGKAGYVVLVDGKSQSAQELSCIQEMKTVEIMPAIAGAGSGIWKIVAGIMLVALAIVFAPAAGGFLGATGSVSASAAFSAGVSSFVGNVGLSLIIGGVAQMLAGTPDANNPAAGERPENRASYLFSGAINTTKQGNAVPIGYGRLRVGSQVISAGMESQDVSI